MTGQRFDPVHVVLGRHTDHLEQWQIVSDEPTSVKAGVEYGERFQILDDSNGLFGLGAPHLRNATSLERLMLSIFTPMLLLVSEGIQVVERGLRRMVDPH